MLLGRGNSPLEYDCNFPDPCIPWLLDPLIFVAMDDSLEVYLDGTQVVFVVVSHGLLKLTLKRLYLFVLESD